MSEPLAGKVVLITGASGIAAAVARSFVGHGAKVMVLDRSEENLDALEAELPEISTINADLLEKDSSTSAIEATLEVYGRLDVLVNVAGISGRRFGDGPVHEATDEGWDTVMDANAKTTFRMCRAALKPMLKTKSGVIINTSSVLAYSPAREFFGTHAYAASKAAIIGLSQSMAAYYAPHGIRVNAVAPGLIATPMSARAQSDEQILKYLQTRQPITGRPGTPEDVADAIFYLASSPFVTGVVLEVAGGWSVAG
jgi:NAD(P)-dependent dehydrogenase (short-subunit alcohol dehydrogenase family)